MVSRSDDDCHDNECPGCRLRARLTKHLDDLARGPEVDWLTEVGELCGTMLQAVDELSLLRIGVATGVPFDEDDAGDAAAAVLTVAGVIDALTERIDQ
jgi:hypothetical protein